MSELKAFEVTRKTLFGRTCTEKVYLKSEADNAITELKEKLKVQTSITEEAWKMKDVYHTSYAEAVKELYEKNKQLRHQKYKRCLDKAEICCEKKENCYNRALRKYTKDEADYLARKSEFWQDWEFRWLKLADKFKEG